MTELVLCRPGASNAAERHWSKIVPLGLGYLAAAARKRGIEVHVVDGKLEGHRTAAETVAAIRARHPAVVGLSALASYIDAPDRGRKLGERGRDCVRTSFLLSTRHQQWEKLLNGLAHAKPINDGQGVPG